MSHRRARPRSARRRRSPGTPASSSARRCPSRCASPVVDSHCHLDIHDGDVGAPWLDGRATRSRRRRPSASRASCRWAATCRARAGRSRRPRSTSTSSRPSRCTPTRRRASRPPAAGPRSRRRTPRSQSLAAAPARAGRRRDRARLLPHRRGRPRRAGGVVPPAHPTWPSALGKPVVIHDRDAHDDVIRVLEDEGAPGARGLPLLLRRRGDGARTAPSAGWYLSFAGHGDVQERAARCARPSPSRRSTGLLVETDAPYLTPDAVPRPAQRVLPRAAHRARDGRGRRRRRGHAGRRALGQHPARLRPLVTPGGLRTISSRDRAAGSGCSASACRAG